MKWKKILFPLLVVFVISCGTFFLFQLTIPKAKPLLTPIAEVKRDSNTKEKIQYVAVGDSLTEGIGDETNRGGFVPIVANDLQERYNLTSVDLENFGVAGERSDQILKRIKKDQEIQDSLKAADIITLTVGGNDVVKVIQSNFFGLSVSSFDKPMDKYRERLAEIFSEIRKLNPTAPIYVLGIYNPFYLNFPEITDMQTIIDNWNQETESFVSTQEEAYFIPINDLLYQGLSDEVGIRGIDENHTEDSTNNSGKKDDLNQVKNNALYEGDKFHPNHLGYQLMANAIRDQLIKTQDQWITKEESK